MTELWHGLPFALDRNGTLPREDTSDWRARWGMRCHRCDGLMMVEQYGDPSEPGGTARFEAFHCMLCGEILDAVILHNRGHETTSRSRDKRREPRVPRALA